MCNRKEERWGKKQKRKKSTHNIHHFRCSVERCRKFILVDVRIDKHMKFGCLGEVLTNPKFVRHPRLLRLNRNDKRWWLKGAMQNLLYCFPRKGAWESASFDFFSEVVRDSVRVGQNGGVVGHDDGLGKWRHVPNSEAEAQIEGEQRVIVEKVMFVQ